MVYLTLKLGESHRVGILEVRSLHIWKAFLKGDWHYQELKTSRRLIISVLNLKVCIAEGFLCVRCWVIFCCCIV